MSKQTPKPPEPEEVARAAEQNAEPPKVNRRGTMTTEEAQERALDSARARLADQGQLVTTGNEVTDAGPAFAGYDKTADSAPVSVAEPAEPAKE